MIQTISAPGRALLWFLPFTLLLGCSTTERHYTEMEEALTIRILPDTSKQFVYRLSPQRLHPAGPVLAGAGNTRPAARPNQRPDRSTYRRLQENTERALVLTGYCRKGYLELDRRISAQVLWIRGECREGATDQDLDRFGGLSELPIQASR